MECMYICIIIIIIITTTIFTNIGDPQPFSFLTLQQRSGFPKTSIMPVSRMIYSLQI
jgi:hypothetical protein